MRVSVVVPTFHRPELLDRCLSALAAQDLEPTDYELIVADDAASAATRRQVEVWSGKCHAALHYVAVTGTHGPAAARNLGWRQARGQIIGFTDDDCIPDRGWLRAGGAAIESGAEAASGRVVVPLPETPTDYERDAAGLERAEFVTANCFVRHATLELVGGFDERFSAAWREDSDLHFALLRRGSRIVHVPDALVVHPVRPAPWGISLRQQRKALFNALLFKKHPTLYRRHIRPTPPWGYYATVAAFGVALVAALAGSSRTSLVAAAVWAVLTGRFFAHRLRRTSHAPKYVAEMVVTSALIPPLSVFWRLYGAFKFRVFFL